MNLTEAIDALVSAMPRVSDASAREQLAQGLGLEELAAPIRASILQDAALSQADRLAACLRVSRAVRNFLVDRARSVNLPTTRRDARRFGIDSVRAARAAEPGIRFLGPAADRSPDEILAVDAALSQLERTDQPAAQAAQLLIFGGFAAHEIASVLGVSERIIKRYWNQWRVLAFAAVRDIESPHFHDEYQMRLFLLGKGDQAEREKIEKRILADPAYSEQMQIVEEDLIDEYLTGELAGTERRQFEARYFSTAENRGELLAAKALLRALRGRQ